MFYLLETEQVRIIRSLFEQEKETIFHLCWEKTFSFYLQGPESKNSASDVRFAVSSPMAVSEEAAEDAKVSRGLRCHLSGLCYSNLLLQFSNKESFILLCISICYVILNFQILSKLCVYLTYFLP